MMVRRTMHFVLPVVASAAFLGVVSSFVSSAAKPTKLNQASLLQLPLPSSLGCFWDSQDVQRRIKPGCEQYYKRDCSVSYQDTDGTIRPCAMVSACPIAYDPVYDVHGTFYPTVCWARALGATEVTNGFSAPLKQFVRDLWYTYKTSASIEGSPLGQASGNNYIVPEPNIEFSYTGSGYGHAKTGVFLRSTLWKNQREALTLDFNINTNLYTDNQISLAPFFGYQTFGVRRNTLLIFIDFDHSYPEKVLKEWTARYAAVVNDYFKKKQLVSKPIQFDMTSVVVAPPKGFSAVLDFSEEQRRMLIAAGTAQAGRDDFTAFIIAPVRLGLSGGTYGFYGNKEIVTAALGADAPYQVADSQAVFHALIAFQDLFNTISHELLHSLGLPGDHVPMGYGPTSPDRDMSWCDYYGLSHDHYFVLPPDELTVRVGAEPPWAQRHASASGACLTPQPSYAGDEFMKDYNQDGTYEFVFTPNIIGRELQRTLGWADVDGDGVAEVADPTPYGGFKKRPGNELQRAAMRGVIRASTFTPQGEVRHRGCRFEKIKLESGFEGLVPLQCKKYNSHVQNLYLRIPYDWMLIPESYGTVLIARLGMDINAEKLIPFIPATPAPQPVQPP